MVARIATGEIADEIKISGRVGGKTAGGVARAAKLAPDIRARIASEAAKARWSKRETGTVTMQTTKGTGADGREAVRMYPNNSLREPVSEYENRVAQVVKSTFTK
jgi:hypothetical protein